jgi:hypothetical protein
MHRLRVFEKSILRKIFGFRKEEGTGDRNKYMLKRFMTF